MIDIQIHTALSGAIPDLLQAVPVLRVPLPASAAADPVLEKTNAKTTPTSRRC